jgi:prepilin-type N-terminal cleavage/methylation domain-containing protein
MMNRKGFTLIELMVGTALLVGAGGALLVGMHYALMHSDYLSDFQIAMNAVHGRLEELSATDFDFLKNDATLADARTPEGQCMGLEEDRNCNGVLDVAAGEDLNGNNQLDEPLPGARLWVRIQESPPGTPMATARLLTLHVAACWSVRGRAIGEDQNCDGDLDAGEDLNENGMLDSPAMASTRIARQI